MNNWFQYCLRREIVVVFVVVVGGGGGGGRGVSGGLNEKISDVCICMHDFKVILAVVS